MKAIFSVLVSQLRGKAGTVVASSWKGIAYFRELITPANPKTTEQTEHREDFSTVVSWYHDIEQQLVDYLKVLTLGKPFTGFNAWVDRNLSDLHTWRTTAKQPLPTNQPARIMPLNAPVNPITDLAAAGGAIGGKIDLTWVQGEATAGDKAYVLSCKMDATNRSRNLVLEEKETTTVQTQALTIHNLEYATTYRLFVLVEHEADSSFSIADSADAQSSPQS